MRDFIDIIKSDRKSKVLFIITIGVLFICTLSYSLSMFNNSKEESIANIKVNGLSFNMTTNTGESDDRILKLKSNTLESFNVVLTNLNTMDVKYELIYEVCTDSTCTNTLDKLPDDVVFGIHTDSVDKTTDLITTTNTKIILLMSNNTTDTDYYIKLNLNAGYSWNELALVNQIEEYHKDIDFIAYVDGVEQEEFPTSCNYTYTYKTYTKGVETTDSEVTLTCSNGIWDINVKNVPNKVKVWFTEKLTETLKEYIASLGETEETRNANGLEYDDTANKNLRYVGSNPNNYIKFNDETWRIIGIVDGGVKIIRQDRVEDADGNNTMKWNTAGTNDWTTASLQTYLNGTYYESLTSTAKEQIEETTWNLGGWSTNAVSASDMYTYERGTTVYSGRPTEWTGNIALMYPSDWGYASTNTSCRTDINSSNCSNSNWLYTSRVESGNDTSQYYEWTMSPYSYDSYGVLGWNSSGYVDSYVGSHSWGARPVVYLKSNIQISSGNGTSSYPYQIQLDN